MTARDFEYAGYVARAARDASRGSPGAVAAVGRLFGLGQPERDALARGSIPGWLWLALGLSAGAIIGVRVQRKWPSRVPAIISGK